MELDSTSVETVGVIELGRKLDTHFAALKAFTIEGRVAMLRMTPQIQELTEA